MHDDKARSRFELVIDGVTAFAEYEVTGGVVTLDSVDGAPAGGLTFGLDLKKCGDR